MLEQPTELPEAGDPVGRILTLRGNFSCDDNAVVVDQRIFQYDAVDLTKGWKVKEAWIWPKTIRAVTGTGDGQLTLAGSLATDSGISDSSFGPQMDAADNRQIGWLNVSYQFRDANTDFLARNNGGFTEGNRLLIDPNTIVATGLYINMYVSSDNTNSPSRDYNYVVILEEKKMQESETILQIIKSTAQDVDN